MTRRVLVPVGGRGSPSRAALDEAVRLVLRGGGVLALIHVADKPLTGVDAPGFAGTPDEAMDRVTRAGARVLRDAWLLAHRQHVDCCTLLCDETDGAVADQVARHARSWGADLVIVGVDARRTSLVASQIRQRVAAPLMTVRWRPARESVLA